MTLTHGQSTNDRGRDGREHERGARPRAQELCRLTVLVRSVQVDIALPVHVPISLLLPGIVDVVDAHRYGEEAPIGWALSRVGRPPLSPTSTLAEASVRDGELLVLAGIDDAAPAPLFDDMMDSVARSSGSGHRPWTRETARATGSIVAVTAVVLACWALVRGPASASAVSVDDRLSAIVAATATLVLMLAGAVVTRAYRDPGTGILLSSCALPFAFTAGVLFVPGTIGLPQLLLGASATAAVAVLSMRIGLHGTALFTGVAGAALSTVAATCVALYTDADASTIGAATVAVGFLGLVFAPRLSMMHARLPLPPVPTAGASLEPDPDSDGDADLSSFAELDSAAQRARAYLGGFVCALTAAISVGALLAAGSESPTRWPALALAVVAAAVLMFRARTYAGAEHAIPLMSGGIVTLTVLAVGAAIRLPDRPLVMFAVSVAGMGTALVLGVVAPRRTFSPVMKRLAEIVEYLAIAALVPLVCWVCGLYAAVRGL